MIGNDEESERIPIAWPAGLIFPDRALGVSPVPSVPRLHRGIADTQDRGKHALADMVRQRMRRISSG